jgi:DNA polymerase III subunit delta
MLIFLYGTDTFRSHEKLSALKNKYMQSSSSGTDLSVLDCDNNSPRQSLEQTFGAQGLFSPKRLIIVNDVVISGTAERQKEFLDFLKSHPELESDSDIVAVFFENGNPKKSSALFKFLVAHAKKQEFSALSGARLTNWTLAYAKELSEEISFSKAALDMLLAFAGDDLHILSNEVGKLVNYKNAGIISEEDIKLMVKSKIDSTMFETIEALASGNKSRALELFHEQLAKGVDAFYILSMYTYQIRTLLKIGDFFWHGMAGAPQIAQASGVHPYVVQKSISQIRNLSEEKTKQMLRDLAGIDMNAKIGRIDPILALDSLIVSL